MNETVDPVAWCVMKQEESKYQKEQIYIMKNLGRTLDTTRYWMKKKKNQMKSKIKEDTLPTYPTIFYVSLASLVSL